MTGNNVEIELDPKFYRVKLGSYEKKGEFKKNTEKDSDDEKD